MSDFFSMERRKVAGKCDEMFPIYKIIHLYGHLSGRKKTNQMQTLLQSLRFAYVQSRAEFSPLSARWKWGIIQALCLLQLQN